MICYVPRAAARRAPQLRMRPRCECYAGHARRTAPRAAAMSRVNIVVDFTPTPFHYHFPCRAEMPSDVTPPRDARHVRARAH